MSNPVACKPALAQSSAQWQAHITQSDHTDLRGAIAKFRLELGHPRSLS